MIFDTPTTRDEMCEILQEIFYYYRIRREADTEVNLSAVELDRMVYTPLTENQSYAKAECRLKSAQTEKVLNYKRGLSDEINELTAKIALLETQKTAAAQQTRADYALATQKAEREAVKRGIAQSSAVIDKLVDLQTDLAAAVNRSDAAYDEKIAAAQARLTALQTRLNGADTYYSQVFEYEILAEQQKIKDEDAKLAREVFRYNNGLDEKEQNSANGVLTSARSLELRYMGVSANSFTKDQLVEMGYYKDAIDCVCAYYDTLSAVAAYQGIAHDTAVAVYLDDYYSNVVYMYKTLANS